MAKMTRDKVLTFRPDSDLFAAMQRLREVHATPYAEQLRRALDKWLTKQPDAGWPVPEQKAARKRAGARRRRTKTKKNRR